MPSNCWLGLRVGGYLGAESAFIKWTGELSQWLCHDDSTVCIIMVIIIIILSESRTVVIVYRASHNTEPRYLSEQLCYVVDMPARGRLRSSTTSLSLLDMRASRRATVGDRSFVTAGHRIWNSLPEDVTSCHIFTSISSQTESTFISTIIPGHYYWPAYT